MLDRRLGKIKIGITTTAICILLGVGLSLSAIAQDNNNNNNRKPIPNRFPPNPLELRTRDPLIPRSRRDRRPLTEEEKARLATALDEFNTQAASKLQAGDEKGALEIWYRELRLRRYLGLLPEVQALSRVGGIVWDRNLRDDVQFISKRLQTIQKQLKPPTDLELLRSLATGFEQVRSPDWAVKVYDQILAAMRQQEDAAGEEATLLKIGDLSLSWFDYPKAIIAYQELLKKVQERGDRVKQIAYLKQLAYIYAKDSQMQKAIVAKQQLIELYRNEQDFAQIPIIQLDIGSDYQAIGNLEQAAQTYQEAYAFAWSIQLYASAADALRKLVALQLSLRQTENALSTLQVLVKADELANNFFGMMNTYDEMAQLYLELKNYPQALTAFQNGLELAQRLKYRESYFARQIQEVRRQANR